MLSPPNAPMFSCTHFQGQNLIPEAVVAPKAGRLQNQEAQWTESPVDAHVNGRRFGRASVIQGGYEMPPAWFPPVEPDPPDWQLRVPSCIGRRPYVDKQTIAHYQWGLIRQWGETYQSSMIGLPDRIRELGLTADRKGLDGLHRGSHYKSGCRAAERQSEDLPTAGRRTGWRENNSCDPTNIVRRGEYHWRFQLLARNIGHALPVAGQEAQRWAVRLGESP